MPAAAAAPDAPITAKASSGVRAWLDTTGRNIAESPYNPLVSAAVVGSLYPAARRQRGAAYPRPAPLLLCAAAFGASGYMNWCGYTVEGSGTMAAWSVVLLSVNGWRRLVRPAFKGRVGPALMGINALFDATVHGFYFATTDPPKPREGSG